jgi:hypothetical protein
MSSYFDWDMWCFWGNRVPSFGITVGNLVLCLAVKW